MPDVAFSFFSALGIVLAIVPAISHWRNRNVATLCLIFWVTLANLIYFLDSVIWSGDIADAWDGKIYCDIVVKLMVRRSSIDTS